MKLYHGSLEQVDKPEIRESDHTLDYGKGFYATTSQEYLFHTPLSLQYLTFIEAKEVTL